MYVTTGRFGRTLEQGRLKMGEGIAGWAAMHGQPIKWLKMPTKTDGSATFMIDSQGFRTKSVLSVPLVIGDELIGVAQVLNVKDKPAFDVSDLETFTGFCRQKPVCDPQRSAFWRRRIK